MFERIHIKTPMWKIHDSQSSNCLSFCIFTWNSMWFDWCRYCMCCEWVFSFASSLCLSKSQANRSQHMPSAHNEYKTHSIPILPFRCTCMLLLHCLYLTVKQSRIEYNFVFSCDTVGSISLTLRILHDISLLLLLLPSLLLLLLFCNLFI